MRGNGKGRTYIVWSQSSTDNIESATFKVEAPNFVAFGLSIKVMLSKDFFTTLCLPKKLCCIKSL